MMYNIPAELAPYLEYIPDDMLSDIITDALRSAIFGGVEKPVETAQQIDMSQLLEQIKGIVGTAGTQEIKSVLSKPQPNVPVNVPIVVSTGDDMDDDMKEKVQRAARSLFK